jgi:hypothetical protein
MRKYEDTERFLNDVAVAAWIAQLFAVYVIVLVLSGGPSEAQWLQADPILRILPRGATLWGVPLLSVTVFLAWRAARPLRPRHVLASVGHVASGAMLAVAGLLALRLVAGPSMPDFVPPEESVKPGFLLGISAGFAEELLFRLALAPLLFVALRRRLGFHSAMVLAVVVTALAFALLHEAGGDAFSERFFIVRFLVPGTVLGLAAFALSPAFVVAMHGTAHIMIPLLFV